MIAQSSTIKFKTVKKYRCDGCQACIFIEPCPACIAKKRLNINIPNQINHAANREKVAETHRRYTAANREKVAEIKRRYYAANREKVAEANRRYRAANREKIAEINRQYRAANREKVAETNRRYYAANREKVADLQKFSRSQLVLI